MSDDLCWCQMRRFDEAITIYQQALLIHRELGHRHGEGLALTSQRNALSEVRRFEEAINAQLQ
ncbi:hypothetical protein [Nonomuraea wenchangensis]|uniref:hypothetical protein n=1 Tax=Nonomuraea wenchangensis TaxID=568860 RepID=UPI0033FC8A61